MQQQQTADRQHHSYLQIGVDLVYHIKCTFHKFASYLRDAMVAQVQLLDSRNNQYVGMATLNFLIYLKNDQQIDQQAVFFHNHLQLTLPIISLNKKNLGQIHISLTLQPQTPSIPSNIHSNIPSNIPSSIMPPNPLQPQSNFMLNLPNISNIHKSYSQQQHSNYQSISPNPPQPSSFKHPFPKQPQHQPQHQPQPHQPPPLSNKRINLQVERMNLKAQAQLLLQFNRPQPIEKVNLIIDSYTPTKLTKHHKNIDYLDLIIKSDLGDKKCRIYPINSQQGQFKTEIALQTKDHLQFIIGDAQGQISVAEAMQKPSTLVGLYNSKFITIGTITIMPTTPIQPPTKAHPITQPITQPPPTTTQPQLNQQPITKMKKYSHKLLVIGVINVLHPFEKMPVVKIGQHKWKYPYHNKYIYSDYGDTLVVTLRDANDEITLGQTNITTYRQVDIVNQNLRCSVLFDDDLKVKEAKVHITIEVGNMKQVNYSLNKQCQPSQPQPIKTIKAEKTESREEPNQQKIIGMRDKMYTQGDKRMESEPLSEANQEVSNLKSYKEEEIYLLEMLSKALHITNLQAIEAATIIPSNQKELIAMWSNLMEQQEPTLSLMLSDMFIQDDMVMFDQLKSCVRSYHNFLELYWTLKEQALKQLIGKVPACQQIIQSNSEIGTIQYSTLWNKTFPNIPYHLQSQLNKLYHISPFSPLITAEIINDLRAIQIGIKALPSQPTSALISDLGKIVKHTIQQLLISETIPIISSQTLNIKSMSQLLFSLGVKVSYWVSLLLIEEIKGWYGLDLGIGEGIISNTTAKEWIATLSKRKNKQVKQLQAKPALKQSQIQLINKKQTISINHSSKIKSELANDEEILNIANLLRENDQFNQPLNTSHSSFQSSQQHNLQPKKQYIQPQSPTPKYIHLHIKEIKLKQVKAQIWKCQLILGKKKKVHFIHNIHQIAGKHFCEQLNSEQALNIIITSQQSLVAKGILLLQDISTKTVVLYNQQNLIVGKLSIQAIINDHYQIIKSNQNTTIKLQIITITPNITIWNVMQDGRVVIQSAKVGRYTLDVHGELYDSQLQLSDADNQLQVLIPLQELFFRGCVQGEYPILHKHENKLVGSINIKLTKQQHKQQVQYYIEQPTIKQTQQLKPSQSLAIFIDQLITFTPQQRQPIVYNLQLSINTLIDHRIMYSSLPIKHTLQYFSITSINNTYYHNSNNQQLTIQVTKEGKEFGKSMIPMIGWSGLINIKGGELMKQKIIMRLKIRVLMISQTNFSIDRILKSVSQPNCSYLSEPPLSPDQLKKIKQLNKLTYTQMDLLQQILLKNQNYIFNPTKPIEKNIEFIEELTFLDIDFKGVLKSQQLCSLMKVFKIQYEFGSNQQSDYIQIIYKMQKQQNSKKIYQEIDRLYQQIIHKYH